MTGGGRRKVVAWETGVGERSAVEREAVVSSMAARAVAGSTVDTVGDR